MSIWTSHAVTQLGVQSLVEVHSLVVVACHHGISVPVSCLVTFGATGITCRTVCSAGWVLSCTVGAVLGGCRWCVTIAIVAGVGHPMPVVVDCTYRFGAV